MTTREDTAASSGTAAPYAPAAERQGSAVLRQLARQLQYEQRTFWRNPGAVFFTFGLPILMLVIFTTLNAGDERPGGRSFGAYFVPGMLTFGLINSTYGYLASKTVVRRDSGLFKRSRATPLPLVVLLTAMVLNAVLITTLITAAVLATGRLVYGVALPTQWGLLAAVLFIGAASFAALGLAVATAISNADAADPVVFGTVLPLLFISGVFDDVPDGTALDRAANIFPVSHLLQSALATSDPDPKNAAAHLAVVAAWGLVGAAIAHRRFRWEPR